MALTDAEKAKIEEEERFRAAARTKAEKKSKSKRAGVGCLVLIGLVILAGLLLAAIGSDTDEADEASEAQREEAAPAAAPADPAVSGPATESPAPVVEPGVIELSGSGQQATEPFPLTEGLAIFRMTHQGEANFSIQLLDGDGGLTELLVNEIGSFDGAKAVEITRAGEYVLDITASGPWTVAIEQPRQIEAAAAPQQFTGTGQAVTPFVRLEAGLARFALTHTGSANFAVLLLNEQGGREELLVNEIGSFDGSKAVRIPRTGAYLLDVAADGAWTIGVE